MLNSLPRSKWSENCVSYWWTNLLYINNLYPKEQHRVSHVYETKTFCLCSTALAIL